MSSSDSVVKHTHQNNFNGYTLTSTLYTYDEIHIVVENTVTKHKYQFAKVAKEILELTQKSGLNLEAEQLYNLYLEAVNQKNENVKLTTSLDTSNNLLLAIAWTLYMQRDEIKFIKTYELLCQPVAQTDTERMEKMFTDFVIQKETLEKTVEELKKVDLTKKLTAVYDYVNSENNSLWNRQMKQNDNLLNRQMKQMDDLKTEVNDALNMVNCGPNNVVNVTIFSDIYKPTPAEIFSMKVDKKSKMSKLFITAQIGLPNRVTVHQQQWTFGRHSTSTITSPLQSPGGRATPLLCMGLFSEHYETGLQTLYLTLPGAKIPLDNDANLYCTVKVEEIM